MGEALNQIRQAADRIQLSVEEILGWLPEDLSVGDDGVAETVIAIENSTVKLQKLLEKKG